MSSVEVIRVSPAVASFRVEGPVPFGIQGIVVTSGFRGGFRRVFLCRCCWGVQGFRASGFGLWGCFRVQDLRFRD